MKAVRHSGERHPQIGVGAVIVDEGKVLLVRRGREPGKGLWSLPGGRLEWGESLREGLEREVLEETGLRVEAGQLAGFAEVRLPKGVNPPEIHYILIDFHCRVIGGQARHADDADDLVWQPLSEIGSISTTEGLGDRLQEWLQAGSVPTAPVNEV